MRRAGAAARHRPLIPIPRLLRRFIFHPGNTTLDLPPSTQGEFATYSGPGYPVDLPQLAPDVWNATLRALKVEMPHAMRLASLLTGGYRWLPAGTPLD